MYKIERLYDVPVNIRDIEIATIENSILSWPFIKLHTIHRTYINTIHDTYYKLFEEIKVTYLAISVRMFNAIRLLISLNNSLKLHPRIVPRKFKWATVDAISNVFFFIFSRSTLNGLL